MVWQIPPEAFRELAAQDRRLSRLVRDVTPIGGNGLEFGPGDNPTLLPDTLTVEYVDYPGSSISAERMPHIDYFWSGTGHLTEICGRAAYYDFAIAAQVGQYIPNFLGWLQGITEVLAVGGVLNMSLPDKRFMFDRRRQVSTLGQLIEAFHCRYTQPSLRQVFEHTYDTVAIEPGELWHRDISDRSIARLCGEHALPLAYRRVLESMATDNYTLCHCWVFTPASFLDLLEGATRLGLLGFIVTHFDPTEAGDWEFFVSLTKIGDEPHNGSQQLQLEAIANARDKLVRTNRIAQRLADPC